MQGDSMLSSDPSSNIYTFCSRSYRFEMRLMVVAEFDCLVSVPSGRLDELRKPDRSALL